MIVAIGGIKGGTGKTTIATNLCYLATTTGKKCLLVDADEQKSASNWALQRASQDVSINWVNIQLSGTAIFHEVKKLSTSFDLIFIDVGGRDTTSQRAALNIADKYILPFRPRAYDVWTIVEMKPIIEEIKSMGNPRLQVYMFLNQADSRGSDNEEALQILQKHNEYICLNQMIGLRKTFSNSSTQGLSIFEMKDKKDPQAIMEMENLYESIFSGSHLIHKDGNLNP